MDHACSAYSYIAVPLYDTLGVCLVTQAESLQVCPSLSNFFSILCPGPDTVKYVVNHAEIEAIFCIPQTLNTVRFFFGPFKAASFNILNYK